MYYTFVVSNNSNNYVFALVGMGHELPFLRNKLRTLLKFYSKQKLIYTLKTAVIE
jgi:hypothetical protein